MLFAFAVDLALWTLAGYGAFRLARRLWPNRAFDPQLIMLGFFIVGALVIMATFTHWLIYK